MSILPLTTYVLALGLGPVIAAPISETYGRHIVYGVSRLNPTRSTLHDGRRLLPEYLDPVHPSPLRWSYLLPKAFHWSWFKRRRRHDPDRATASAFYILSPFLGPALG